MSILQTWSDSSAYGKMLSFLLTIQQYLLTFINSLNEITNPTAQFTHFARHPRHWTRLNLLTQLNSILPNPVIERSENQRPCQEFQTTFNSIMHEFQMTKRGAIDSYKLLGTDKSKIPVVGGHRKKCCCMCIKTQNRLKLQVAKIVDS